MIGSWERTEMRLRITVPNKQVNAVARDTKSGQLGKVVRVGPRFYCDDDATAMLLLMRAGATHIEERPLPGAR